MLYTYRDLIVWQKAMDLVVLVYEMTKEFPTEERYGLVSQMRRAAVSIPSNIAEGRLRGSDRSYRVFFLHAFGSAGELDTQIQLVKRIPELFKSKIPAVESLLEEVIKMLNKMIEQLSASTVLRT